MDINFPYTAVELTGSVNRIPNLYGLINELGVFPSVGVSSRLVEIRREEDGLAVLPMAEPGGPPSVVERKPGDALYFEIPHFPLMDKIDPADLQGMLQAVGNQLTTPTLESEVAKRLLSIRRRHAITLEWLRMGALRGLITDGKGVTVYNLFTSFGITKKTVFFNLASNTADIIGACEELFQHIATNLKGETMSGVEVIVSSEFFNTFVQHPKVEKFWVNWQAAAEMSQMQRDNLGGQYGRTFRFQNILFREYIGIAPVNGVSTRFVAANKGHARPVGTMDTFRTYNAPAHDIRFVNQPGQEIYISPKVLDHGAGVEMRSQSNPLAICRRPEVLVEVDAAAA